jgi:hypothetical protein
MSIGVPASKALRDEFHGFRHTRGLVAAAGCCGTRSAYYPILDVLILRDVEY